MINLIKKLKINGSVNSIENSWTDIGTDFLFYSCYYSTKRYLIKRNRFHKSSSSLESKYCFSSSFKFVEFVCSPWLGFRVMISKIWNSSNSIATLFNMSFITFVYVIMEWIFKWKGIGLIGSLDSNSYSTNNSFIWSPRVRNKSSSIEQSWSNDVGFEILLNSTLFHVPSDNFDWCIRLVSYLNLM